jgi:hypothetical protein
MPPAAAPAAAAAPPARRRSSPRLRKKPPPAAAAPSPPYKKRRVGDNADVSCAICISQVCDCPAAINGCDHQFCFDCIKQWSTTENSCPLCKARFTEIQQGRKKTKVAQRDQKSEASVALEGLLASLGNHPRFGRLFASRFHGVNPFAGMPDSDDSDDDEFDDDDDDDEDGFLPGFMNVVLRTTVSTTTHSMALSMPPPPSGGNTAETAIDLADSDDDDDVEVLHVTRSI